jgi:CDP-glucose 4,6-dehydratase
MNADFWRGRRVFLTGHTGFKGSWLSLWLSKLGAEVTGYALAPPTRPNLFELAGIADSLHSIIADIRDAAQLEQALLQAQPEIVIHMAAQSLVRPSYQDPLTTYAVNVMGTAHLLEAVRKAPAVRAVVVVTTDKCYDNKEWLWGYREDEALGGHDPYSSSKACAELVTAAYRKSFFSAANSTTAIASVRAGNVIGGGDWATDRLVPDVLAAFAAGRTVTLRNPDAIRPWQHVLEPLSGYLELAERLYTEGARHAQAWNFGPADSAAQPVRWIVERLAAHWGGAAHWAVDQTPQPHEANYLKLDSSKARMQLGWTPRWSLDDALFRIAVWHQAYLAGHDLRTHTLNEINDYESTCH